jgi:hypothetical protein
MHFPRKETPPNNKNDVLPDSELPVGVRLDLVAEGGAADGDLAEGVAAGLFVFLALEVTKVAGFAIVDKPPEKDLLLL